MQRIRLKRKQLEMFASAFALRTALLPETVQELELYLLVGAGDRLRLCVAKPDAPGHRADGLPLFDLPVDIRPSDVTFVN